MLFVSEAQELHHDLKEAYSYFFEEREKEIEKAKKKANEVVSEAEKKAEKIIADIRKMQQQIGQGSVKERSFTLPCPICCCILRISAMIFSAFFSASDTTSFAFFFAFSISFSRSSKK